MTVAFTLWHRQAPDGGSYREMLAIYANECAKAAALLESLSLRLASADEALATATQHAETNIMALTDLLAESDAREIELKARLTSAENNEEFQRKKAEAAERDAESQLRRAELLERESDEALCFAEGPSTLLEMARLCIENGLQRHDAERRNVELQSAAGILDGILNERDQHIEDLERRLASAERNEEFQRKKAEAAERELDEARRMLAEADATVAGLIGYPVAVMLPNAAIARHRSRIGEKKIERPVNDPTLHELYDVWKDSGNSPWCKP
jgi:hypothetical protein